MVAPSVLHALQAVAPLKRGRCEVREADPVKPVPEAWIDASLQHVNPQTRAMIQLQRYTGMRPGEAAIIRGCDLETTEKIWMYRPASHKTQHHGRQRVIYFGPKAQETVKPFLRPDLMAYLFSPREAMEQWHQQRRAERESPIGVLT